MPAGKEKQKQGLEMGILADAASKKSGKAIAWSLFLCGYESWTIEKSSKDRTIALET